MTTIRRILSARLFVLTIGVLVVASACNAAADDARVLPEGRLPDDSRLGPLKTLDGYFPFVPQSVDCGLAVRRSRPRRQLLVATGLWPLPAKIAAPAVIHGRVDRDGYTVEKVILRKLSRLLRDRQLYRPREYRAACLACSARMGIDEWPIQ